MAAVAAVARGDDRRAALAPGCDDAVDRRRGELRPVGEHDHRRLDLRAERGEPAAERGARPALPVRAGDGAFELVRTRDDHDLIDAAESLEHGGEEQALLRRAEPRRGAGREDDGSDQDSLNRDALDHDRHRGRPVAGPERVDRLDRLHPLRDLADDGVLGRQAGVRGR